MCIKVDILSTLTYFDLFDYPLSQPEIWQFLRTPCDSRDLNQALAELVRSALIYRCREFYSLKNDDSIALHRIKGNQQAGQLMKTAKKVAQILARFPFVEGVAISGSLSKNFATESSDIDLFIITSPNRLWLARTLMHAFKKLSYLVHCEHLFCMNYFIDLEGLEIEEKNIYTAIEVVTLIPLHGESVFKKFRSANSWSKSFLPNHFLRVSKAEMPKFSFPKFVLEKIFNNPFGDYLDNFLRRITAARWNKKTLGNKKNMKGIVMSMIAKKHLAKPDPAFFQQKLLNSFNEKLSRLSKLFEQENIVTR
jgi:predicted nucleotidyltransferase